MKKKSKFGKLLSILLTATMLLTLLLSQSTFAITEFEMSVQGTLTDDKGSPLSGYAIMYAFQRNSDGYKEGGNSSFVNLYSDSSGQFSFTTSITEHGASEWMLYVRASYNGLLADQVIAINPGATVTVPLSIDTHETFIVHIEDKSGNPAPAGVPFWFSYVSPYGSGWPDNAPLDGVSAEKYTNSGGTISFESTSSGAAYPAGKPSNGIGPLYQTSGLRYEYSGDPTGLTIHTPRGTDEKTIQVKPLGKVVATAKDSVTNEVVEEARFTVPYNPLSPSPTDTSFNKYMTVTNGVTSIYGFGDLTISAVAYSDPHIGFLGYNSGSTTNTFTPWGTDTVDVLMTRQSFGTLDGYVTDNNGNPVSGAQVELVWYGQTETFYGYESVDSTTTDGNGYYSFANLIPSDGNGEYVVRATTAGYFGEVSGINLYSGETTTVDDVQLVGLQGVCRIDMTQYVSLDDALAAVTSGQIIILLEDITDNNGLVINNGYPFTIDLGGYVLTVNNPSPTGVGLSVSNGSFVSLNDTMPGSALNVTGNYIGVKADYNSFITVTNVTVTGEGSCGVFADGGGEIMVLGDVTASAGDGGAYSVGAMAYSTMVGLDSGKVFIGGNVTAGGPESDGVFVGNSGEITIDGTLTSGHNYINLSEGVIKNPEDSEEEEYTTKEGYYTYTYTSTEGDTNNVWIKIPAAVTSITVSPATAAVQKGNTQAFTATVSGTNNPAQSVTWSVYGNNSVGTSINSSGLITVAADETASTLTVTATSTADNSKSGTATVTVTAAAATTYTVTFNNNSSVYSTKTVNAGESISIANWPADPARSSYTFGGWFTGAEGSGTQFTPATSVNAAITVYAKWTYIGGNENGNADEGGSNPSTPATPAYNADVKAGNSAETTLPVTVDKVAGTASIDAGSQNLTQGGTVITVPSIPDVDTYSVGIPVPDLSTADEQGTLTLDTDAGSVTVPSNMLTGISGISGNKAKISIGQGDKDSLPDKVKSAIGDKPLIQLTLSIDGNQTNWNNPNAPVTVSIPYTPTAAELTNPESIVIWYIDGSGNVVTIPNGHYDPATGMVTFSTTHFSDYAVAYNKVNFNDVATNAWYNKAVSFIAARKITSGTGNGNYSPDAKLTRGEFIVLMMKAYGISPDVNPTDNFADAGNTYYTGYIAAAKRLGITSGVGNNMYAPGNEITRQEMFTLLYNALKTISKLPQGDSGKTLSDFTDAGQIDAWAKDAMTLLVKTGTVGGSYGKLAPTGTTTRAEMAQVLYNLLGK